MIEQKALMVDGKILIIDVVGRVFSVSLGKYLAEHKPDGNRRYPYVKINYKKYDIHRLIALAFLGESKLPCVLHENDLPILDCHISALRYGTHKNNYWDTKHPTEIRKLQKSIKVF